MNSHFKRRFQQVAISRSLFLSNIEFLHKIFVKRRHKMLTSQEVGLKEAAWRSPHVLFLEIHLNFLIELMFRSLPRSS